MTAGWGGQADRNSRSNSFEGTPRQAAEPDQAMSALQAVFQDKALLDQTPVVLGSEFGRTPRISENDGREHHDKAFTCLLAGAGSRLNTHKGGHPQ